MSTPPTHAGLAWRAAEPADAAAVSAAIDAWWPGQHMVHGVCPQLFEHMGDTCIIVEEQGRLVGFLVGYLSQRRPGAGYVHYAGVHPDLRGGGLGHEMYRRFADLVRRRGGTHLYAETGTWNTRSIAFHRSIGFRLEPGDEVIEGIPVHHDEAGVGFDFVVMTMPLGQGEVA